MEGFGNESVGVKGGWKEKRRRDRMRDDGGA
jgi:hypothetical protein